MTAQAARPAPAAAPEGRRVAGRAWAPGVAAVAAMLLVALPAGAQSRDEVPERYRPPPGMCRVWIDEVPASRQPAPTDCPTAIRNKPSNARVLFGDKPGPDNPSVQPRTLRPSERPDTARPRREKKPQESPERAVVDEARKLLEKRRKP